MATIDTLININITESAAAVATESTTIPIILGTTNPGWEDGDVVHAYSAASGLLSDGFTATSPEYLFALALTAQDVTPSEFLVGRRSGATTAGQPEISRISVNDVQGNHVYKITVNGSLYSYTSQATDSASLIVSGLQASVAADSAAIATATVDTGNAYLILTGKQDGVALNVTGVDAGLTLSQVQASENAEAPALAVSDLSAIQAQDDSWYGLVLAGASDDEIMTAASWIQSQRKMLFAATTTADVGTGTVTSDVASKLKAGSFSRTAIVFSPASAATGIAAAWVGGQLPQTPGTNNWAIKTLLGQASDKLSTGQQLACIGNPQAGVQGKNANIYVKAGGQNVTLLGTVGSGDFIDNVIGIDWLFFNLQSALFSILVNTPGKVPYTDAGMTLLKSSVFNVLNIAADNELIDRSTIEVNAPKVSTATKQMKAARKAPTITFSATLQGAIDVITINGTVTV